MSNAQTTLTFFANTDAKAKKMVLSNIAKHYGISIEEAEAEVTDSEAESLLDYVTGPTRNALYVVMQRHGLI